MSHSGNAADGEFRLSLNVTDMPPVKLVKKVRIGSRVRRQYDPPQTPLERVRACQDADPAKVAALVCINATLDPFVLAAGL